MICFVFKIFCWIMFSIPELNQVIGECKFISYHMGMICQHDHTKNKSLRTWKLSIFRIIIRKENNSDSIVTFPKFQKTFYDKKNVYKPQNSLIQNLSTNLTCFIIHCCCEHSIYPPTSILNAVTPVIGLSHKYC